MTKMRRFFSFLLALSLCTTFVPVFDVNTFAASDSDMDALTALGIDTSEEPEGYDPYSTDNPYGKNTIELSPVYELYKVGLTDKVTYDASFDAGETTLKNGEDTKNHQKEATGNELEATLYGNEKWQQSVSSIMGDGDTETVASGTTTTKGDYTVISRGTVTDTAASNIPSNGYLKDYVGASTDLGGDFDFALSSVAAGNFNGNEKGLSSQTVMVYTSDYTNNGGLYLRFGDAVDGSYGASAKELLKTSDTIGNPNLMDNGIPVENFGANPYQLQNYLQVTTGDWNNDGLDEVAVYIPEEGNSRLVVYALQLTNQDDKDTAYQNPDKWSVVWTYYFREGDVVSNMVSFASGDVNLDGTDDLAATWGYYYGPDQNTGSKAAVLFGAKGTEMLTDSQEFDLTYGSSNIVRGAFSFGDMAGSDEDVLILCGQSDADLKEGNTETRYVALYDWDGVQFQSSVYQNFNLFEEKNGNLIWPAMTRGDKEFQSLPLCVSNTAVISQGITGGGDLLYFDSLIIEYTDNGLKIKEAWDIAPAMQEDVSNPEQYVEYDAVAGDLTGENGAATLFTMTQTLSQTEDKTATYTIQGSHEEPVYGVAYYYKNWFNKLFGIKTYYVKITGYQTVTDTSDVNCKYTTSHLGNAYFVTADMFTDDVMRSETDFSTSICLANTDVDSSYMSYGGSHYYTYTDPEVLAVLASPPYFSDLVERDDLSGSYAESTTSYSTSEGTTGGVNLSATITVGAYVSFEQDIEVFGVKVASVEAEATVTSGFTFETEITSTLEQTITYSATSGEDMVAFYSIPMEIYEYTSYIADGNGGYEEVLTTVNIPHEASIRLISKEEYEFIAKDYQVLPSIADTVLTHTIGDPATYPESTDGYQVIAAYDGTPSAVGFSSTEGGSGISQEIAMSTELGTAFTASVGVEAKAGAGAGGVKAGIIAGAEAGAGFVLVTTDGSAFSGEMQNMPIEAQPYNYGMNWRIFCYKYSDGGTNFPVVSYLVSEVQNPPSIPDDFAQDMAATTADSVTLNWSYDKNIAGFRIYRYYEFPEGSGSYEIKYVPFSEAIAYDDNTGTYYFSYTDEQLSPYTEYSYQIKSVRATNPKESIYSEPMICRTKTAVGYPDIQLDGLDDEGALPIYPDADSTVTVVIAEADSYNGLSYQWQKNENGMWEDLSGQTEKTFTISNAGSADQGLYRCRINAIYYDSNAGENYYISAFSHQFDTAYEKRSPIVSLMVEETAGTDSHGNVLNGLSASVELYSANVGHTAAPSGTLTFTVEGTDYEYSETVDLARQDTNKWFADVAAFKQYATASISIPDLQEGVYTVSTYYSGSRVFQDNASEEGELVIVGDGSAYQLILSPQEDGNSVTEFEYGQSIYPTLNAVSKDLNGDIVSVESPATFKIKEVGEDSSTAFSAGDPTPYVGSYILEAYEGANMVATEDFHVNKKPITIYVEDKHDVSKGTVSENFPVIASTDITETELDALNLEYSVTNSAGNRDELDNETDPGKYTVTAKTSSSTPDDRYNNYSVSYVSGTYTIIGATYRLTAVAQDYTDDAGTRPVGTVGISNVQQNYADFTAETQVLLYATPEDGYEVDMWTATFEDHSVQTQDGNNTFTLKTQAQPVSVTATFKPGEIQLSTVVDPLIAGAIVCEDEYFSSGAYVSYGAQYPFTAVPAQGYHFSKWLIIAGGISDTPSGVTNEDGTNDLTVTVGNSSMTVYGVFARDEYTLTLDGQITAYYLFDDDNNPTTDPVRKTIESGTAVSGDTEITVTPKAGYDAAPDAYFTINGVETTEQEEVQFNIIADTQVTLQTSQNTYAVDITAPNGTVKTKVNGATATSEQLASVEGGSEIVCTPTADRGYVFDHWVLNGTPVEDKEILTISTLGNHTDIEAVFVANDEYTATASVSNDDRGSMLYTLYDIYGEMVGTEDMSMPAGGVTVYKGESIVFTADINSGSMMEQWNINGENLYTTDRTYTVSEVTDDIDAVAYLKAASKYQVNFIAMGDTGSTLVAEIDDTPLLSGELQYGGSELVLTADPMDGYMVDYWTVTLGNLITPEFSAMTDENLVKIVTPELTIDPLKQNITVRAHYAETATNLVTLPDTQTMGVSKITYITPIEPTDDGMRDLTSSEVRAGGKVMMTCQANGGYVTDKTQLEQAFIAASNPTAVVEVTEDSGVFTVSVSNLTQPITLQESDLYNIQYTVTVPDHVVASPVASKAGETITLTVTPQSGYVFSDLSLDHGTLNEEVSQKNLVYTFTMPASDVIVTYEQSKKVSSGGGGGLGGSADDTGSIPLDINGKSLKVDVTIDDENATVALDGDTLQEMGMATGVVTLNLSSFEEVNTITIDENGFEEMMDSDDVEALSVEFDHASVTFDLEALSAIGDAGSGDVSLEVTQVEEDRLTAEEQALVGDKPVYDLTLSVDGAMVSKFGEGSAQVSVPYTLGANEDPGHVAVWYLSDEGVLEAVKGEYDATTGSVVFTTNHFSEFVIGTLPFDDVERNAWYYDSVSFAYANKLFAGTNENTFAPNVSMTRAMLVTVLWRMEQEPVSMTTAFDDVANDTWYTNAVAWAYENGLVSGYGDGNFGANDVVTREQMAVILLNYATYKGYDTSVTTDIGAYVDSNTVSVWAVDAMRWANAVELIRGMENSTMQPQNDATRAQVATIFMRLIEQVEK